MGQRPESVKELQCTSRVSAMAILLVTITSKIQCKPWACSCVLPSYGGGCGGGATFWRSPVTYAIGHFSRSQFCCRGRVLRQFARKAISSRIQRTGRARSKPNHVFRLRPWSRSAHFSSVR